MSSGDCPIKVTFILPRPHSHSKNKNINKVNKFTVGNNSSHGH
jgi:hypothetical protein